MFQTRLKLTTLHDMQANALVEVLVRCLGDASLFGMGVRLLLQGTTEMGGEPAGPSHTRLVSHTLLLLRIRGATSQEQGATAQGAATLCRTIVEACRDLQHVWPSSA